MCLFIQGVNEEPPPKYEPNKDQRKHEDFKWIKYDQYTHEYVYHHGITEDFSANNNFLQSHISSPKCGVKFPQHEMD